MDSIEKRQRIALAAMYRSIESRGINSHDCKAPDYLSQMGQSNDSGNSKAISREQCREQDQFYVTNGGFGCCQLRGTKRSFEENKNDENDEYEGGGKRSRQFGPKPKGKRSQSDLNHPSKRIRQEPSDQSSEMVDAMSDSELQQQYLAFPYSHPTALFSKNSRSRR